MTLTAEEQKWVDDLYDPFSSTVWPDLPDEFRTLEFVNKVLDSRKYIELRYFEVIGVVIDAPTFIKLLELRSPQIDRTRLHNIKKYEWWYTNHVSKEVFDKAICLLELSL